MQRWRRVGVASVVALALTFALLAGLSRLLDDATGTPRGALSVAARGQSRASKARAIATRLRAPAMRTPKRTELALREQERDDERKKEPEKKEEVEKPEGQIVETARPEREDRPLDAKYLGRYDMKVEREQKSQGKKREGRELGHRKIDNPSELQSPTSKSEAPTQIAAPKSAQQPRKERQRRPQRQARKAAPTAAPSLAEGPAPPTQAAPADGPGASPGGANDPERPQPSVVRGATSQMLLPATSAGNILHNMQALAGSPGSNDYLPDVTDEGDTNLLNTRKYRYWDFFQRVRERVSHEWDPASVWRARDPTGKRYGVRDRLTIVRVTLGADGDVRALRIKKPSGLGFLDEEASRAFFAGGPYPNPPAGLVNERGEVEFQFGFMFEISSSRFRFYRMDR